VIPEVFADDLRRLNASPNPDAPAPDAAFIRAAPFTPSLGHRALTPAILMRAAPDAGHYPLARPPRK
jgi:hypothetical protein